jgi:nitrous oxidase accessory protein
MIGARVAVAVVLALAVSGTRAAEAPPVDAGPWLHARLAAARPGEVIDVPPGVYQGPFTISISIHLRGGGRAALVGNGKAHVVSVRAPDVTIEGFEIRNSGLDLGQDQAAVHITSARATVRNNRITESLHGVYVRQANGARIEGNTIIGKAWTLEPVNPFAGASAPGGAEVCEVTLTQDRRGNGVHIWNSSGHLVAGNVIRDTRDGIYFSFVDRSEVRSNDVRNVRYGLHYMYSDENRFEANEFRENAAGAALMYSNGITLTRNVFASS